MVHAYLIALNSVVTVQTHILAMLVSQDIIPTLLEVVLQLAHLTVLYVPVLITAHVVNLDMN